MLCLASSHVYQPCFPYSVHKNLSSPPVRLEIPFDAAFLLFVLLSFRLFFDILRCFSSMTVYGSDAAALEAAGKKQVLKVNFSNILIAQKPG